MIAAHGSRRRTAGLALALALALSMAVTGTAAPGRAAASEPLGQRLPGAQSVTLPTGDRVTVDVLPDGRLVATPEDPRPGVGFQTLERGHDLYLFPSDARGLRDGTWDIEQFNLSRLLGHERRSQPPPEDEQAAEEFLLTFVTLRHDGTPTTAVDFVDFLAVVDVEDSSRFAQFVALNGPVETFSVPAGTYGATLTTWESDGIAVTSAPQIDVTDHTVVVLDGRQATEITVDVATHETELDHTLMGWAHVPENGSAWASRMWTSRGNKLYAAPTDPVTVGHFEVSSFLRLVSPADAADPALFDLLFVEDEGVPDSLDYILAAADVDDLTRVDVAFHSSLADGQVNERRGYWRPWEQLALAVLGPVSTPTERTDHVSVGDSRWQQIVRTTPLNRNIFSPTVEYRQTGERHTQTWLRQPIVTGVLGHGGHDPDLRLQREGDMLFVRFPDFTDADGNWGWRAGPPPGHDWGFSLYDDDTGELAYQKFMPRGEFVLPPGPARYRIEVELDRDGFAAPPWESWLMSPRVDTTWWFESARPPAGTTDLLPLLLIGYDADLDLRNTIRWPDESGRPATVALRVGHQRGVDGASIASVAVWTSFDDGATWTTTEIDRREDGSHRFALDPLDLPANAEHLSLRVEAWDADGNGVRQQIIRAYALPT